MNKLSLAGLIFGLILLSSLFFAIGFLASIATFGTGKNVTPTTWANVNNQDSGTLSIIGKVTGAVAGSLLQDQETKIRSRLGGGAFSKVASKIPPSLQPFAVQAQNQITLRTQQNIAHMTESATNKASQFFSARGSAKQYQPRQETQIDQSNTKANRRTKTMPPPAFAPKKPQNNAQQDQPIYYSHSG